MLCMHCQAERLQQYRDQIAHQSAALSSSASLHAHSNLEQLVDRITQEEEAQRDAQARFDLISAAATSLA